jgi:hypothetical protein
MPAVFVANALTPPLHQRRRGDNSKTMLLLLLRACLEPHRLAGLVGGEARGWAARGATQAGPGRGHFLLLSGYLAARKSEPNSDKAIPKRTSAIFMNTTAMNSFKILLNATT